MLNDLWALKPYLLKHKRLLWLGLLLVLLSNIFSILPPKIIRICIDTVIARLEQYKMLNTIVLQELFKTELINIILIFGIMIITLSLIKGIFMFLMRQTLIVMSRHIEYDQKNDLYAQYQSMDIEFLKTHTTGDLMSRISEDISRVRMFTGPSIMYTANMIVIVLAIVIAMLQVNVQLTLLVLIPLPILSYIIFRVNKLVNIHGDAIQRQLARITTIAQENFAGIRVVKSFAIEKILSTQFASQSELYKHENLKLAKIQSFWAPVMVGLIGLSTIITIYVGGNMVIDGVITTGHIAEFIIYITMLTWPISSIGWVAGITQRAAVSQRRINELMNIKPSIINHSKTVREIQANSIKLENVRFTYPHSKIKAIQNLSLNIAKGERVMILGKTGSGKSSFLQLLVRAYDPDTGKIMIGDIPLQTFDIQFLRESIGYIAQDIFLFSDTIRRNITFGMKDADEQEVIKAATIAGIHDEICALPHAYDTIIGERGVMLSGGQKQRIAIARAIIKKPKILLFDDSLSAVDVQTEQKIQYELDLHLQGVTTIFITQRIFENLKINRIFVLENGMIIENGTHSELMNSNGYYRNLFKLQKENLNHK